MDIYALDIVYLRWFNLLLTLFGIIYAHIVARKFERYWIGVPAIVWLFQAAFFYFIYLLYAYGVLLMSLTTASRIFSYWTSFSKLLGLLTMFSYLYYIDKSCRRGNVS